MHLTVICCPTQGHRSQGDPKVVMARKCVELNSHLGYLMGQRGGFLELSDYFVRYASYRGQLEALGREPRYRDRMLVILDGPAGKPQRAATWGKSHRMAGSFRPDTLNKRPLPALEGGSTFLPQVGETATGYGWNRNVIYLMTLLNWIFGEASACDDRRLIKARTLRGRTPQTPRMRAAVDELQAYLEAIGQARLEKVSVIGWSRGAVTAIKVANALAGNGIYRSVQDATTTYPRYVGFDVFDSVGVSMFSIDPVAGPSNMQTKRNRVLPRNVTRYVCPISLAEHRAGFAPQDKERMIVDHPRRTKVLFLPFPGLHESPSHLFLEGHKRHTWGTAAVGQIVYGLLAQMLIHDNPRFDTVLAQVSAPIAGEFPPSRHSRLELLALYTHLAIFRPKYFAAKHFPKSIPGTLLGTEDTMYRTKVAYGRDRMIPRAEYVRFPYYFVNEHHRLVFKAALPRTYELIVSWAHPRDRMRQQLDDALGASMSHRLNATPAQRLLKQLVRLSVLECVVEHHPDVYSWEKGGRVKNGLSLLGRAADKGKVNTLLADDALERGAWSMFQPVRVTPSDDALSSLLSELFPRRLDAYLDHERWLHDTYRFRTPRGAWRSVDRALRALDRAHAESAGSTDAAARSALSPHCDRLRKALDTRIARSGGRDSRRPAGRRLLRALKRQAPSS